MALPGENGRCQTTTHAVAMVTFSGFTVNDAVALLKTNYSTNGLPCFGLNDDGEITLEASFPICADFPLKWARRQLMISMGYLAEQGRELMDLWSRNQPSNQQAGSDTAVNVAKVAGVFLALPHFVWRGGGIIMVNIPRPTSGGSNFAPATRPLPDRHPPDPSRWAGYHLGR